MVLERCVYEDGLLISKMPDGEPVILSDANAHCALGRRLGYVTKQSPRKVEITELTEPTRGSIRFGTRLGQNGHLYMLVGPIPDEFYMGVVHNDKGKVASLKQIQAVAKQAQKLVTQVYDMPQSIRGDTYQEIAEFVTAAMGLGG